jgi:hypothetical protein
VGHLRAAAAAIALLLALALAGCGGASDQTSAGGDADAVAAKVDAGPSAAEFKRSASDICRRGGEEIKKGLATFAEAQGVKSVAGMTLAQQEEFIAEVVVPSVKEQAVGLARLAAPDGDEKKVAALVEGLEEVARVGGEAANGILTRSSPPIAAANRAAKSYGIQECEQP